MSEAELFELQNTGDNSLQVVLPQGVSTRDVRGVWIDDLPVDWQETDDRDATASGGKDNTVFVPLPAAYWLWIFAFLLSYALLTHYVKVWFFNKFGVD